MSPLVSPLSIACAGAKLRTRVQFRKVNRISILPSNEPEMKKAHPKMGFLVLSLWASSKGMRLLAWKTYRRKLWINVRKEV